MVVGASEQFTLPDKVLAVELPFSIALVDEDTGEVVPVPLSGWQCRGCQYQGACR